MAKWKKAKRPRAAPGDAESVRVSPPKRRMKAYLDLPQQVAATAESQAFALPVPNDLRERMLRQFDMAVMLRGTNSLKAVRLLCREGYWEFASPIVRQLFELVLNMEHLAHHPGREEQILRYVKFALLQKAQRRLGHLRYDEKTDRTVDRDAIAAVDAVLETDFQEFRSGKSQRWANNWSGRTTKQLAESSPRGIRVDQYELLYRGWSDQTHASPVALLDNIFPDPDAENIVNSDDTRVAEAVALAINLFIDLHELLPTLPPLPREQRDAWLRELLTEAQRRGAVPKAPIASGDAPAEDEIPPR